MRRKEMRNGKKTETQTCSWMLATSQKNLSINILMFTYHSIQTDRHDICWNDCKRLSFVNQSNNKFMKATHHHVICWQQFIIVEKLFYFMINLSLLSRYEQIAHIDGHNNVDKWPVFVDVETRSNNFQLINLWNSFKWNSTTTESRRKIFSIRVQCVSLVVAFKSN